MLEGQNATVAMLGLVGGLLGANLLAGQAPSATQPVIGKTMAVEELVIVDDSGKKRAHLGTTDEGIMLSFFDDKGEPRLVIGCGWEEPSIRMMDSKGQTRISAGILDAASVIFLKNKTGAPVTQLSATDSGGNLHFFSDTLEPLWQARP